MNIFNWRKQTRKVYNGIHLEKRKTDQLKYNNLIKEKCKVFIISTE